MDRKTSVSLSDRQRARDNHWRQNNAAEHNDQSYRRINKGHYGQCHCRAVRPFCLSRDICSGTDAESLRAQFVPGISARTSGERFETVVWRNLQTLSLFAQSLPFEITRKPGVVLDSRPGLSDRYQRQKLRGSQLPSTGRNLKLLPLEPLEMDRTRCAFHFPRVGFQGVRCCLQPPSSQLTAVPAMPRSRNIRIPPLANSSKCPA